jgi:hypothetical protein
MAMTVFAGCAAKEEAPDQRKEQAKAEPKGKIILCNDDEHAGQRTSGRDPAGLHRKKRDMTWTL